MTCVFDLTAMLMVIVLKILKMMKDKIRDVVVVYVVVAVWSS